MSQPERLLRLNVAYINEERFVDEISKGLEATMCMDSEICLSNPRSEFSCPKISTFTSNGGQLLEGVHPYL